MIPFCDLPAQHAPLRAEILAAVGRVLDSCQFGLGEEVSAFERDFAAACGARHAAGVSSGSDALHLALLAFGIGGGDEVIVPAMTFCATAAAVEWCGARPVFADIDESGCLCPQAAARAIGKKTRAIVPVHLYGQPADMASICAIAKPHGIAVIEDAAQAHLATAKVHGDAAAYSFYPSKNLGACGEGGAVVSDGKIVIDKIKQMRNWGGENGFNRRMHAMQAAALCVKLRHLPKWTAQRRAAAKTYRAMLGGVAGLDLPQLRDERHVYHLFVALIKKRARAARALEQIGAGYGFHYRRALHLMPRFAKYGGKRGDCPIAERFADRGLSLPIFAEISERQISEVCAALKKTGK